MTGRRFPIWLLFFSLGLDGLVAVSMVRHGRPELVCIPVVCFASVMVLWFYTPRIGPLPGRLYVGVSLLHVAAVVFTLFAQETWLAALGMPLALQPGLLGVMIGNLKRSDHIVP